MIRIRNVASIVFLAVFAASSFGQSVDKPASFEISDVRVSPHRVIPIFEKSALIDDRYSLKQARIVDLIADAYGVDVEDIQGGPIWLETDRYDVIAKTQPTTSPAALKLMMQSLLANRFNLLVHKGSKPMPAYVLTSQKGKSKLKPADGTEKSACLFSPAPPPAPSPVPDLAFSCHNLSMDEFAQQIHDMAGDYLLEPVVNSTSLEGTWDFNFKFTRFVQLHRAEPNGTTIFDAVEKQLGLKLDLQTAPRPVLIVDSVNQKPTTNSPGIEKALPPLPPIQFDVAVIKPSKPEITSQSGKVTKDQVDLQGATLRWLICFAWDLNPDDKDIIADAPKWISSDHFDILAKIPNDPHTKTASRVSKEDLQAMLKTLLIERFQIKSHTEDRVLNSYNLVATNPKMKKADPLSRTRCLEGPKPGDKDPRLTNTVLNRVISCQNVTMAQLGIELQYTVGGYIFNPILDTTGLKGGWDFTLNFTTAGQLLSAGAKTSESENGTLTTASDPSGALTLFDAIDKELGVKLVKQKRPVPVLVIDHIDEKPTDN